MTGKIAFTEVIQPRIGDLFVFVDETGHETFAGTQDYYGLGGCAFLAEHHEYLKAKWREVRRRINGDPEIPLHSSSMKRSPENFAELKEFFLDRSFVRFAAVITKGASISVGLPPYVPVMGQLKTQVSQFAAAIPCGRVLLTFESSDRGNPIITAAHDQIVLGVETVKPVEKIIMPKSSNEPGLEIADFIVGTAKSQVRREGEGEPGFSQDFMDVFCAVPEIGRSYCQVLEARLNPDGQISTRANHLIAVTAE